MFNPIESNFPFVFHPARECQCVMLFCLAATRQQPFEIGLYVCNECVLCIYIIHICIYVKQSKCVMILHHIQNNAEQVPIYLHSALAFQAYLYYQQNMYG